jgi:transcriptional regulator with XRE-family HTH domain
MEVSEAKQQLAAMLRSTRLAANMSGAALAQQLGWSQPRVFRTEHQQSTPRPADVQAWAQAVGASADQRAQMVRLAEIVAYQLSSWQTTDTAQRQRDLRAAATRATAIRSFHPAAVHGLLQTPAYARAALHLIKPDRTDLEEALAARMERQAVLLDHHKQFEFIMTPAAISWRLADTPGLIEDQAERLITVSGLANVTVAVVPPGALAPVLPLCGYGLYEIQDESFVVIESMTGELVLTDERYLTAYREAHARLLAAAVTGREAADLIRAAAAAATPAGT